MTDLDAYFRRINYTGSRAPTLDTLSALVAAHNRSIPFENLDPLLGRPVYDLSAEALVDKLVYRRRGGYCYEQNGLMRYALRDLGFGVDALAGRVVWMSPGGVDGPPPAQTHNTLSVSAPGVDGRFLVDVGFGGQTLSSPIRLEAGVIQETRHEPYRIREHDAQYVLEACIRETWEPLYLFTTRPQPLIDLQVGSWYVSTYPGSHFVTGLMVALVTDDARWNLGGRDLTIHRRDGTERIRFDSATEVVAALTERFGIDLTGLGDVEARISEVLET
ncbi:MAG TPA: arylamine N-acetyltransferase [Mycobacterium sp.]|nr:arylamine N-acetyltransferase [Mycobacterium sp.]